MESKNRRKSVKSKSKEIPSAPPGFRSLTSFMLKKVAKTDKSECDPICMESILKLNDAAAYRAILKHRPWILFDHSNCDPEKSNTEDFPQVCWEMMRACLWGVWHRGMGFLICLFQ